ncbi:MAG: hypothetical protein LAO24_02895 [Acidobacteriia bacterium]|nr:hypothetical protein [Terriglobia bacterium]
MAQPDSLLDAGVVSDGVYRNKTLGLSCKIPVGWVLRTEEMNAREDEGDSERANPEAGTQSGPTSGKESEPPRTRRDTKDNQGSTPPSGRVLLAAFSRPPEATGEDVNSSILIAAESVSAYPGLKEAAQYFGPVSEVAKAQGFKVVEEPYEFPLGTKKLVRGDFQKDVGTRVMRQSTLVMLVHGYAISVTFIGGTEEEVEGLIGGLSFGAGEGSRK